MAVLLAVGLYGARAGWFGGGGDDEFQRPTNLGQAPPKHTMTPREDLLATVDWGTPENAPIVGVGAASTPDAPPQATLPVADGKASLRIRVPRARQDGTPYTSFLVEVRSGSQRIWGGNVPAKSAHDRDETIALSLNTNVLGTVGADVNALSVLVGGSAPRKGDTLGIIRIALQQTP